MAFLWAFSIRIAFYCDTSRIITLCLWSTIICWRVCSFTLRILCTLAILLTRMKIFNSFVRKHFTQKPQLIASSLFLTCLFIDSPVAFALKISSYHYYTDNKQENVNTFYIMTASDFSSTPYGQLLLAFTSFFLNLLLTLVVGVIMNIVSVCQYKSYLRGKKSQRDEAYKRASNPGKSEQVLVLKRQEMTVKEANEKKSRKEFAIYGCNIF